MNTIQDMFMFLVETFESVHVNLKSNLYVLTIDLLPTGREYTYQGVPVEYRSFYGTTWEHVVLDAYERILDDFKEGELKILPAPIVNGN